MSSSTTSLTGTLSFLPPEIFEAISQSIPLHIVVPTLLALCLTDRQISSKTERLLYHVLVLRDEDSATMVFGKIQQHPEIGRVVREIYVLSERSAAMRKRSDTSRTFTFLGGLKQILAQGLLPNLVSLGIHNQSRWTLDEFPMSRINEYSLPGAFWHNLASVAPGIRSIYLRQLADNHRSPWVNDDLIDKIFLQKKLKSLELSIGELDIGVNVLPMQVSIFKNVASMQHCLQTLSLQSVNMSPKDTGNESIVSLKFPHLLYLDLEGFSCSDTVLTSHFWSRHKRLEHIKLWVCTGSWFGKAAFRGLLPRLTHFKGSFTEVCALSPILNQLVSLCIFDTVNMQVPYLLQNLVGQALPNLRSLEIQQERSNTDPAVFRKGAMWFKPANEESPMKGDGKKNEPAFYKNALDSNYLSWIVNACPNLEELGFLGHYLRHVDILTKLKPFHSQLPYLRHVYYPSYHLLETADAPPNLTRELADLCPRLESITALMKGAPPLSAWVVRDQDGKARNVSVNQRWGMVISVHNNCPFPELRNYIRLFNLV